MPNEELLKVREIAQRLAGVPIVEIAPAGTGANSRVFRVVTADRNFALKCYPVRPGDPRARASTEWKTLTFLHANGVDAVPRPFARDPAGLYLLMDWIDGESVTVIGPQDIRAAADFICDIFRLSALLQSKNFPPASEACLSAREIVRQIDERRAALTPTTEIEFFISNTIGPVIDEQRMALAQEISADWNLGPSFRRLIPADFGFHNTLRLPDGSLRYIDFDYFGWDDPVKLAADFIVHPGMSLDISQRRAFAAYISEALPHDQDFKPRLHRHIKLYAARWSLILLNPFRADREMELSADPATRAKLAATRIDKAQRVLAIADSIN